MLLQVRIDAEQLLHEVVEGWFPLRNVKGKEMRGGGKIRLRVRLIGIPDNPVYARGINAKDPNSAAVEDAFFPERGGNQVIMYQVDHLQCGLWLCHNISNTADGKRGQSRAIGESVLDRASQGFSGHAIRNERKRSACSGDPARPCGINPLPWGATMSST